MLGRIVGVDRLRVDSQSYIRPQNLQVEEK